MQVAGVILLVVGVIGLFRLAHLLVELGRLRQSRKRWRRLIGTYDGGEGLERGNHRLDPSGFLAGLIAKVALMPGAERGGFFSRRSSASEGVAGRVSRLGARAGRPDRRVLRPEHVGRSGGGCAGDPVRLERLQRPAHGLSEEHAWGTQQGLGRALLVQPMPRVTIEHTAGVATIVAGGSMRTTRRSCRRRSRRLARDRSVVVDLGLVSFMDSTALGVVVRSVREIEERGDDSRVVLPQGTARRIFEITTLDRVLPVAEPSESSRSAYGDGVRYFTIRTSVPWPSGQARRRARRRSRG